MELKRDGVLLSQLESLRSENDNTWMEIIEAEFNRDIERYVQLDEALTEKYAQDCVNPAKENIFRAFRECSFDKTVLVYVGQDPYPNREHANGLAFSIPNGCSFMPPTLKNIIKELESDVGVSEQVAQGDLSNWAKQGVLLLNTALTVETGLPNSHKDLWGDFSTQILRELNKRKQTPLAFVLWGNNAKAIGKVLEKEVPKGAKRLFHYSVHPSPLSSYRGFFGSKPFSKMNNYLIENDLQPIKW